jgi:hypothetical protein
MGDARQRLVFEVRSALEVADSFERFKGSMKSAAMNAALAAIGLDIDVNNVTSESIGKAIGQQVSDASGMPAVNVFDAGAVRAMLLKEGCGLILQDLGVSGERSIDGLALAVEKLVTAELKQAAAGDGEGVLSAVNVSAERLQKMKRKQGVDYNVPRKFDKKSVSNRERQAKFRESHKRVWIT